MAFTDFDALSPPVWQGARNFVDLTHDRMFWTATSNTFLFLAMALPLRMLAALGLALLLCRHRRGVGVYPVLVFLPTVIPYVAYATPFGFGCSIRFTGH